jgi:serine/threonine protein kinase
MRATMCGTPLYASPELLRGERYDEKIDLWAVGVMAYELYFGRGPFGIRLEEELGRIVRDWDNLDYG